MSKFFTLTKTNTKKYNSKNNSKNMTVGFLIQSSSLEKCKPFIAMSLICAIVFMVGFYVVQVTSTATSGFKISEQKQSIEELKLANEILAEKINKLENLDNIKEEADKLGLAKVEHVEYLDLNTSGFALR